MVGMGMAVFLLGMPVALNAQSQDKPQSSLQSLLGESGSTDSGGGGLQSLLQESGGGTSNQTGNQESETQESNSSQLPSREDLLKRGDNIQKKLLKNPNNQEQLQKLITAYVKQNYPDIFYTKGTSTGDMQILLANTKLYQGQQLRLAVVKQHVNKALDFSNAEYTWTVKRGSKLVTTSKGQSKDTLGFTPQETGPFTVRVDVAFPNGTTKTGTLSFEVYERTNIDYRPVNPGKGDTVTLRAVRRFPDKQVTWKLDGDVFAKDTYEPSFQEHKGYGESYKVEVSVKEPETGQTIYYGTTDIRVKKPTVSVRAYNPETQRTQVVKDSLMVNNKKTLKFRVHPRSFPQGKSLNHVFRVNGDIEQEGADPEFTMDVSPTDSPTLEVATQSGDQGPVANQKVTINPDDKDKLSASVSEQTGNQWPKFHSKGLLVFLSVVGLGGVLGRIK